MKSTFFVRLRNMVNRLGFRARAILMLAVSFLLFSLITAGITPMLTGRVMSLSEIKEGEKIASVLARQSTLTVLYKSAANGAEAVSNTMAFPDIVFVDIRDDADLSILKSGQDADHWNPKDYLRGTRLKETVLAYETIGNWHFLCPITTDIPDTELALTPIKNEYLGYVHVVRSKASLDRLRATLLSYIVVLTVFALTVALLLLWWLANLLVRPVSALANTLARARSNPLPIRADEQGPPEIANMAREFNDLMQRLEEHRQLLETKVQLRTSELVQARDLALSADRRKSEFLAMISHELRTPLQSLISYTEQAMHAVKRWGDNTAATDLNIVLEEADHIVTLINNLLDFAKIEAGRMDVEWSNVNVRALAGEVAGIIKPLARARHNQLLLVYDSVVDFCHSDRQKLLQIMINLLSNACKFTMDGTITFRILCESGMFILSVSDTGTGIAAADQKIIFEAFQQARLDNHPGGAGLGLAITNRLCTLLGGSISVTSEVGKGSTFTVKIPMGMQE